MPTSAPDVPVDICNLALDYLSERPIASIESPNSEKEETLARWYDHVREVCLREYQFNFSLTYTTLARTGDGYASYDDAYTLPNDCLRVVSLGEDRIDPVTDYEIFGRQIHASEGNSLNLWYIQNVTEVSKMDALFVNILALRLALKVAYKFTKKKSVIETLMQILKTEEGKALSIDGQERPPRRIQRSKYLSARRFGGSVGQDNRYYNLE